jgi:hypothetical protein
MGDWVVIEHRDSTCVADHGDKRQKLTELRFHFGIGDGEGLTALYSLHDHYDIFKTPIRSDCNFPQEPIAIAIREFAAILVVWEATQLEFLRSRGGFGDGYCYCPLYGGPLLHGCRFIGTSLGSQPGCQHGKYPRCQLDFGSDVSLHRWSSCRH